MSKTVGDYQIKEKIGKGSFAEVYLGVNIHDGKKFAVKVISKELINSEPKLAAGLESEIRIMHEFIHPHIVRLHRNFSSEKNVYLVLDYCQGGDLSKFIRKKGRLTEAVAVRFLHQLAEGLFFLKEKNFIHRDLKPANVLLTEFSENAIVKLADFGFARYLLEAALAQTRCGTPLYMAPEILESKDYDAKADIWSVGCIFYEMLAGTCPFKGQNEMDLLRNIRTKELRMLDDVVVSRPSLEIVSRLLEKDPARRPSIEMLLSLTTRLNAALPTIPAVPSTPTTPVPAAPAAEVRKESAERDEAEANTLRTALQSPAQQMSTPSSARSMRRLETTPSAPPIVVEGGSARSTPRASEDRSSRDSHRGREAHTAEDDFIFIEYTARKGSFQSAVDQALTVQAEEPVADHSDGPDVSEQEIMKNVAQRCSVFCELLNALTNVADRSIAQNPCNLQFFRAKPDDDVSKLSCTCPQEALKWCVRACSLYLHSLSLLQGFMSTLGNYADHLLESTTFQLFKKDLLGVFEHIVERAEKCQRLIAFIAAATPNSQYTRVTVPKAEGIMLEEALSLESEARVKDQLGDLAKARYQFLFAARLLRGISMTIADSDNRKIINAVHQHCQRIETEIRECEERMQELGIKAKTLIPVT